MEDILKEILVNQEVMRLQLQKLEEELRDSQRYIKDMVYEIAMDTVELRKF